MSRKERLECDWNGCAEAIEVVPGQPLDDTWLVISVTVLYSPTKTMSVYLGPTHAEMWRSNNMAVLESVLGAPPA